MCNPVAIMWAGAAVSAVGAARKGTAQKNAEDDAASSLDYQAAVDRDNAQAEAELIRRQGERDRGASIASAAASGVKIGEGSTLDAERQILADSEVDAALTIMNGERQARGLEAQARTRRRAGRDAQIAGFLEGAGSLLSQGARGLKGRRTATYNYNDDADGMKFSRTGADVRARR